VPVVASDIPAVREVVGEAVPSVRLVPPRDADAFAAAITAMLADAPDVAPGRSRARHFTWRQTAVRTAQSYQDALL
jgi:glycosyltransferase involved in cell wall biosynthesis